MVDYSLGKIYKIKCNTTGLVYYGSTCEPTLSRRLANHKMAYQRYLKTFKLYCSSYRVLENKNYEIVLVENFPCNSKDELNSRENYYIENFECVNKYRAFQPNREHIRMAYEYIPVSRREENNNSAVKYIPVHEREYYKQQQLEEEKKKIDFREKVMSEIREANMNYFLQHISGKA